MTKTRYIMSAGLAFFENKDMEKLHRFSLKGWHVSDFKFMGYTLKKGESSDFIYSVDYRSLKDEEKGEYVEFFSSSGWHHIATQGTVHLFRASPGTNPIYSDQDTTVEKYDNSIRSMKNTAIGLVLLTVLLWVGAMISSGFFKSFFQIAANVFSILTILSAWVLIATYKNKWKAKEKKGFVNLLRTILFLLFSFAIVSLFASVPNSPLRILAYMVGGAIVFPTAIWVIMSLLHQILGKRLDNGQ
jgi:general stress protein CsbA